MYDNRDSIDFGKTEIPKLFRSIFVPTLLGMVFNMAFVLTDGVFVGHGVGPDGLASVNLIAPIMMLVTGLGMMFGVGSSVVAAVHLAKGNRKAARINVTQAYYACVFFALLLGGVLYACPDRILPLLGVSDMLMPMAKEYYLYFIPTTIFLMFQLVGEFVIRLDGSPKFAMYANIVPAVLNMILDYVFIFPCGMGVKGAALATDIGTGVGALLTLIYMVRYAKNLRFYRLKWTQTSLKLSLRNVGYMIKLGFPAFVGEFAISATILTGNLVIGYYMGDHGVEAYSVICYLFPVVYMIFSAVSQSAQPIISFNYGAALKQRTLRTFVHSVSISLAFAAVMTALFVLFSPNIISVFLGAGSQAFQLAVQGLPLFSVGFLFMAFNVSAIGYFQSIEQSGLATFLMALRGIFGVVSAFLLLPLLFGIESLWIAVPVAEFITFVVEVALHLFSKPTQPQQV
ncbi:MAG: MATE family efflux transporter [Bacteroidales bacterium]|nr:MATE family efflux transporter [Candidatus Colimorpha onthohippi]